MTNTSPDVLTGGRWERSPVLHVMTWRPDPEPDLDTTPDPRSTCGTEWGAKVHRREGTQTCDQCRDAVRIARAGHRRRKVVDHYETTPSPAPATDGQHEGDRP